MKTHAIALMLLFLTATTLPAGALQQDWLLYGHDTSRNAYTAAESHYNLNYTGVLWSYYTGGWVQSPPVGDDVNNDGFLEIAVGSDNGNLYLLDNKGQLLWNYTTGGRIRTSPAIGNLNMDPYLEVVVASEDNRLYAFDHQGSLLWSRKSKEPIMTSPSIVEVSYNNRGSEVVYAAGDVVYVLSGSGEEIQSYRFTEDINHHIVIADVNNDGSMEFILASSDSTIHVLSRFFTPLKQFVVEGQRISPPIAVDMNGDSIKDVVFASLSDGAYHVYHTTYSGANSCYTGTCLTKDVQYLRLYPQWSSASTSMLMPPPVVADLNNDGRLDMVLKTSDSTISAFNGSGFNAMTYSINGLVKQNPAVGDLDGDSKMEILFGADDGNVYMLNYPEGGRLIIHVNGSIRSSPAIADINRDGKLEILFGADDGNVYALGDVYQQTQKKANESLTKAGKAISAGDKKAALEHISTALGLYIWLKDDEGISTANAMMAEINSSRNADVYLENANTLYLTYDLQQAGELCQQALQLYTASNNIEGQVKATDLLNKIRVHLEADGNYKKGLGVYNTEGVSQQAAEHLNKARAGYVAVGYEPGVSKTEAVLKRLTADEYLQNASIFHSTGDYSRAKEYAEKALAIYSELNYEEGMNSSVFIIGSSLKASSTAQADYSYLLYGLAGLLGLLALLITAAIAYKLIRRFGGGREPPHEPSSGQAEYSPPWFEVKKTTPKSQPEATQTRITIPKSSKLEANAHKTASSPQDVYQSKKAFFAEEPENKENPAGKEEAGGGEATVDERMLSMEARLKSIENRLKGRVSPKEGEKTG